MFKYDISEKLKRKLKKISKKDKTLALNFYKKLKEIINKNKNTISTYKNLKSPLNHLKRIHLTDNFILLFVVNIEENHIVFIDIMHWNKAYKNS